VFFFVAHRAKKKNIFRIAVFRIMINMMNFKKINNLTPTAMITGLSDFKSFFPLGRPGSRETIRVDDFRFSGSFVTAFIRACSSFTR